MAHKYQIAIQPQPNLCITCVELW